MPQSNVSPIEPGAPTYSTASPAPNSDSSQASIRASIPASRSDSISALDPGVASGLSGTDAVHLARSVREAQRRLAESSPEVRSRVLRRAASLLAERSAALLTANRRDLEAARGERSPFLHRLELSEAKLETLRRGTLQLADGEDPLGRAVRRTLLDDGLELRQVQSPLGVLLVIFESRPDAVVQIASLALRTGNGVILKGGREATASNRALAGCLREALTLEGLPPDAVVLVEGRSAVKELLTLDGLIDLVIPRGSGELVKEIQASTRIPVLGHAEGVCHLYLDRAADPAMAARLAVDGKCDHPAACNATETLLVHRHFLRYLPRVAAALAAHGVRFRCCPSALQVLPDASPVKDGDWHREYGDLVLSIRVVEDLDEAIDHIHTFGSSHTDAIVTEDAETAEAFLHRVDSASVFWNASTRFADGYRYGLGAEVGIATGRIHARGPVGADGLLTTRWLLFGSGQAVTDYGDGGRAFLHQPLPTTPE